MGVTRGVTNALFTNTFILKGPPLLSSERTSLHPLPPYFYYLYNDCCVALSSVCFTTRGKPRISLSSLSSSVQQLVSQHQQQQQQQRQNQQRQNQQQQQQRRQQERRASGGSGGGRQDSGGLRPPAPPPPRHTTQQTPPSQQLNDARSAATLQREVSGKLQVSVFCFFVFTFFVFFILLILYDTFFS